MGLRIIFMGTPDFAVPTLMELATRGHDIACVYSRAPRPAGRGMEMQDTPVAKAARGLGIEVRTPKSLKTPEEQDAFRALKADCAVVVAYGLILPKPILGAVPLGCFNLHASLLPRWRGAAPINRAVMAGDTDSGVMVMKMDEGLDTGDVAMAERIAIGPNMSAGELHDRLAPLGADLMVRAMAALERDGLQLEKQAEDGVTYAQKIEKGETRINFSQNAQAVHNHCRGLSPFPGAWFELPGLSPARIKVLRTELAEGAGTPGTLLDDHLTIACGTGAIRIKDLQRAGKQAMTADEFLRGARLKAGDRLA